MSENILSFIYTINLRESNSREINTKNYTYPYILFTIPLEEEEDENTLEEEDENTLENFRNNFILDNICVYFNWVYNYICLIF